MKKKVTSTKSRSDWKRLQTMSDKEIDLSDNPELTPEMFARAVMRQGRAPASRKKSTEKRFSTNKPGR